MFRPCSSLIIFSPRAFIPFSGPGSPKAWNLSGSDCCNVFGAFRNGKPGVFSHHRRLFAPFLQARRKMAQGIGAAAGVAAWALMIGAVVAGEKKLEEYKPKFEDVPESEK